MSCSDEKTIWQERYRSIVDLEEHLHRNGTRIIKFFLHLSKDEQRKRFLDRIDEPDKNWKFSLADVEERTFWKQYMQAYEACLRATSTADAPWYVVPADDKENARLIISEIILDVFNGLNMAYPEPSAKRRQELHGDTQEACAVKTYRDENRRESKTLGQRIVYARVASTRNCSTSSPASQR